LTGAGEGAVLIVNVEATAGLAKVQNAAENLVEEIKEVFEGKGDAQDMKEAAKDFSEAVQESLEQVVFDEGNEIDDSSKNNCCKC